MAATTRQRLQPMKKLPVPSAAEQAQIAKQLDETYPSEHVAEKDHALAEKLLELADSPGNSAAERYMLFTKAVGLAAGTSDFNLAFRGVDSLDAAYEIDGFEMKQKLLDDAAKTITTADQVAAVVAAAEQVIDQSLADERYDTALELAATAKKAGGESPCRSSTPQGGDRSHRPSRARDRGTPEGGGGRNRSRGHARKIPRRPRGESHLGPLVLPL